LFEFQIHQKKIVPFGATEVAVAVQDMREMMLEGRFQENWVASLNKVTFQN
jgi:sigma54-dependent transcription regulator